MVVEVAHALDKRRRSGEVTTADMVDAISFVRLLVSMVPAEPLVTQAIHLARQYDLTVYDALYVALAEERLVGLVTADRKLARPPHATLLGS